jgi:hypothetical protein
MKIEGIEGMTINGLAAEVQRGGKFIIFQYCVSVIILTFKRPSKIYFIRAGEGSFGKGIGYTLISLLFGWWGIPWGPIYTIQSLIKNFGGGKDVTAEVFRALTAESAGQP